METKSLLGYAVKSGEQFVHTDFQRTWISYEKPQPISQADAYRRIAAFITDHPEEHARFGAVVVPVYRELTPLESASRELGALLTSLTKRHGLDLGLTQEQVERQIAKELAELGASGGAVLKLIGR